MEFLDFDNVLAKIYDGNSKIDPYIYLAAHFDLLKNEVILFPLKNRIPGARHSELIQIVKDHEDECNQNCRDNFSMFEEKLQSIVEKRIKYFKFYEKSKEFVEKNLIKARKNIFSKRNLFKDTKEDDEANLQIRNEWIEAKGKIFKKNLFFVDYFKDENIGSFIMIEPYCLGDLQIKIIK